MRNRYKTLKIQVFFKIIVYEQKISTPTQIIQSSEKCRIRLMRSAIIKKAKQDKQQNQTTTTNIIYIQIFMSVFF